MRTIGVKSRDKKEKIYYDVRQIRCKREKLRGGRGRTGWRRGWAQRRDGGRTLRVVPDPAGGRLGVRCLIHRRFSWRRRRRLLRRLLLRRRRWRWLGLRRRRLLIANDTWVAADGGSGDGGAGCGATEVVTGAGSHRRGARADGRLAAFLK